MSWTRKCGSFMREKLEDVKCKIPRAMPFGTRVHLLLEGLACGICTTDICLEEIKGIKEKS